MTSSARLTSIVLACVLLAAFETGFIASLPGAWRFLPVVFATSVYLVQLRGWRFGGWLLAGFGVLLDLLGIGALPWQTLAYGAAALAVYAVSLHVFSNRSLYGLLGAGLAGWTAWAAGQAAVWGALALTRQGAPDGRAFLAYLGWHLFFLMLLLAILFYAVPRRTRLPVHR